MAVETLLNKNTVSTLKKCVGLLSIRDRKRYFLLVTLQAALGFLDLISVGIVGVIGALSIKGVQSQSPDGRLVAVLRMFGISELNTQVQVTILASIAIFIMVSKTIVSMIVNKKTLSFLSHRGAILSKEILTKAIGAPKISLGTTSSQELQYVIGGGVAAVTIGILGGCAAVFSDACLLVIVGMGTFAIDPLISFVSITFFSVIGTALYYVMHVKARFIGFELARLSVESNVTLHEVLTSYRELFVRNRREYYIDKLARIRLELAENLARQNFLPSISKYVMELAVSLGIFAIAAFQFFFHDAATAVAGIAVFMAAGSRIAPAVFRIQQNMIQVQTNLGASEPTLAFISKIIAIEPEIIKSNIEEMLRENFLPTVVMSDVSLRYTEKMDYAVRSVSLTIPAGAFVGVVGSSGAGKTSLVDLLLGIRTPSEGYVTISGIPPIEAFKKWPGSVSYVPQELGFIDGTVAENIALGFDLNQIKMEDIYTAIQMASLSESISMMPGGVNAHVGENASRISGGQRQRLGIARALLSKPGLLVLDEATSALDGQTENDISQALGQLRGGMTIVMIAHRLSTVRFADMIIYMSKGEVVAQGTFEEVRAQIPDFDNQAKLMGL